MEENGSLKTEADKLRVALDTEAKKVISSTVKKYNDFAANKAAEIKEETDRENQRVLKELKNRTEFLGGKISEDTLKVIKKRHLAGHYKTLMKNDEKSYVDFILWKEFGQKRIEAMKKDISKTVKKGEFQKLIKDPKIESGNAMQKDAGKNDFSSWGEANPTGVEMG